MRFIFLGFEKIKLITSIDPAHFTIARTKPSNNLKIIMGEMKRQFNKVMLDIVQKYGYMR